MIFGKISGSKQQLSHKQVGSIVNWSKAHEFDELSRSFAQRKFYITGKLITLTVQILLDLELYHMLKNNAA